MMGRKRKSKASKRLTVLVYQHADGDAAKVEAVQEVLDVLVGDRVIPISLLILNHALCHGGDHIVVPVPDGDQGICEPGRTWRPSENTL